MNVDITLKNYRCFPDTNPAKFTIRDGFTAFVGINNSGKSSLLKFFYEFRNLFEKISGGRLLSALRKQVSFEFPSTISDIQEVFSNTNERDLILEISFNRTDDKNPLLKPYKIIITVIRGRNVWSADILLGNNKISIGGQSTITGRIFESVKDSPEINKLDLVDLYKFGQEIRNSIYIGPFRNAINVQASESYYDIQVGQDFVRNWSNLKTGNIIKHNEETARLTEDIKRIFGYSGLEINPSPDNKTLKILINRKSYKLSELGSGLSQFILVLANVSTKHPHFLFIDEPELNLHPSLQLDFLTTLGSYTRNGVLFATHNIGLARSAADRIYSLSTIGEGISDVKELESTPRLSEFLGELSFSGYRELGYNKVLLVEGMTDIKTMQQFLRLYKKDHEIVLLPLGGSDMINGISETELAEITRISEDSFALIDCERNSGKDKIPDERIQFRKICNKLKITCHILEKRATEYYLTDEAIIKVKGNKYRALNRFEKLTDLEHRWGKSENWRIAREMSKEDLDKTDLGKFLKSI